MKILKHHTSFILFFTVASVASLAIACSVAPPAESSTTTDSSTEVIAATSSALNIADPCATSGPNIVFDIQHAGDQGEYYRPSVYINSICPRAHEDRPETIVEYDGAHVNDAYSYHVDGVWEQDAMTKAGCEERHIEASLWQLETDGLWHTIPGTHQIIFGQWNGIACKDPKWTASKVKTAEATRFRLHAHVFDSNGNFTGVDIFGHNDGVCQFCP